MKQLLFILLCMLSFSSTLAFANIVVGGTRVVFDGTRKAATLSIDNKDKTASLVQSWLTPIDATSPPKDCFIITPPLFRMGAGEQATLRIVRSGKPLPEDRESMYWLNVKGIPAAEEEEGAGKNMLQIAINSQIKLIFRPASLKALYSEDYAEKLQWQAVGQMIKVKNPTPFYANLFELIVDGKTIPGNWFIAPYAELSIPVEKPQTHGQVTWQIINDFGLAGKHYSAAY
ncbi:fimbria/pilus periplasmic chaperone [Atlantibacter sp.]|uniref:fimbria/pilus periplasmic chaperone n=1 Tax=Atlantibacter sp. TaxID=1903473 RepID=UPI0028ADBF3E|nr:fimbria/pilus periplasmic chaperone [Atlantibacter sp.]